MKDIRGALVDHIPHLRRYAWSLMRNSDEADDLVQDCLVRAIRNQGSFQPGTNLRAWLFTILHNIYVDAVRRRNTVRAHAAQQEIPVYNGVEPNQLNAMDLVRLDWALRQLHEDQKTTLLLVALEGMSYKETAEITGVAIGTVKSRVARARETIRQLMTYGNQYAGPPIENKPLPNETPGMTRPEQRSEKDCIF